MIRPRVQPGRGFTLTEVLFFLGILSVFSLISTHLFMAEIRVTFESQRATNAAVHMDHLVRALRRDVWSASSVEATPTRLSIRQPGTAPIVWTVGPDGAVERSSTEASADHWKLLQAKLSFRQEGPSVVLCASAPGQQLQQVRLLSQLQLEVRP